jgi:hypothetical protein
MRALRLLWSEVEVRYGHIPAGQTFPIDTRFVPIAAVEDESLRDRTGPETAACQGMLSGVSASNASFAVVQLLCVAVDHPTRQGAPSVALLVDRLR